MNFEFKRRSKICSKTDRELGPGEKYFSILFEQDGEVVRNEIAEVAWEGAPENCISWWQSRIPERDPNKFFWAPNDVGIDSFESFLNDEAKQVERFVLALLLIQKRIFKLVDTEKGEDGGETIYLSCNRRGSNYEVAVCHPESEEIDSIQDDLVELLFSDEPFEELGAGIDPDSGSELEMLETSSAVAGKEDEATEDEATEDEEYEDEEDEATEDEEYEDTEDEE
ncbi:MAG: hypothetical protein VX438_15490 [Planctomycetota bacterium]|nr:hypothetical protein [Planctomycetota bacterium]